MRRGGGRSCLFPEARHDIDKTLQEGSTVSTRLEKRRRRKERTRRDETGRRGQKVDSP